MADETGPSRVLLDDFTITVSPTEYALSTIQAGEVKDIAEELVEAAFEAHDWGPATVYQYMGFTRVEAVSFYNQAYSVIRVKGGIVSFDGSSQVVPSHVEIQTMIAAILDPSGGGEKGEFGLTEALQATEDFEFVEEIIYDVLWEPTPAPSVAKETTPPPTIVITTPQTEAPTAYTPVVSVPVDSNGSRAPDDTSTSSTGGGLLPAIIGVVAGLILLAFAISLLVMKRRKRARQVWRQDGIHRVYDMDSDLEQQAMKSDGMAGHSEAGSSRLGRLLLSSTAASATGRGMFRSATEVTPPQSSDSSTDDDDFSGFDDSKVVSVEPIIIPIEDDLNGNDGNQVVQTEVNLEKNIAALVALQVASAQQQETNQAKEPQVVAEEGVLFVESNAADCCADPLVSCGEYSAACLTSVVGGGCENQEETNEEDTDVATVDVNVEEEVQESEETPPLLEMNQVNDIAQVEHDGEVPTCETKEEALQAVHDVDESKDDSDDAANPMLVDETTLIPDANPDSTVDIQEEDTDTDTDNVVQEKDRDASKDTGEEEEQAHAAIDEEEEQVHAAEQDADLMAIVDSVDDVSDLVIEDDDSQPDTIEEYGVVEVVNRDPINEDDCREVDIEMQLNAEPQEENADESQENNIRKCFVMSPPVCTTLTCGPYNRWSDVSSENSQGGQSMSDGDDQHEFKPDESWDWDDSTDVVDDPFQTASTIPLNDTKPLLGNGDLIGMQKQVASDETVDSSNPTSSDFQESESDATSNDPFQTPNDLPANDEKTLLSRLLATYKLDKITCAANDDLVESEDSEKRKRRLRSRSSPPHTKRRTLHLA